MNWKEAKNIEKNKYELPGEWLKIEYFEALNILFRIENSLRLFVYIILKNEFQDKWDSLSITSDDQEDSVIKAIAKKRLAQDKNYAYLGYVLNSPLLHLTSGELIRIITSDSYWKLFKRYFLGTKEIMKNKLDEIGNVRNSLAHFRPIKKGDIDLIKQNSIHALSELEKTIRDFISCPDIVPTNCDEKWYKELSIVGIEECKISFMQSKKEEWIKVSLDFSAHILERKNYGNIAYLKATNLKTDNILSHFPELTKHAICITENLPFMFTKDINKLKIIKAIRFTFSKTSISKNYTLIKQEIEKILFKITNELALIKEDNLARGQLIEIVTCTLKRTNENAYFYSEGDVFQTSLNEDSPVEFFGTINYTTDDFITQAEKYPWMPVSISEDKDLPF